MLKRINNEHGKHYGMVQGKKEEGKQSTENWNQCQRRLSNRGEEEVIELWRRENSSSIEENLRAKGDGKICEEKGGNGGEGIRDGGREQLDKRIGGSSHHNLDFNRQRFELGLKASYQTWARISYKPSVPFVKSFSDTNRINPTTYIVY